MSCSVAPRIPHRKPSRAPTLDPVHLRKCTQDVRAVVNVPATTDTSTFVLHETVIDCPRRANEINLVTFWPLDDGNAVDPVRIVPDKGGGRVANNMTVYIQLSGKSMAEIERMSTTSKAVYRPDYSREVHLAMNHAIELRRSRTYMRVVAVGTIAHSAQTFVNMRLQVQPKRPVGGWDHVRKGPDRFNSVPLGQSQVVARVP